MQPSQDMLISNLRPQQQPKITKDVLRMVDQLHAKLNRVNADVLSQERVSRALDQQLAQLKAQYRQMQADLRMAQEQFAAQQQSHQEIVVQSQSQAKQTESFISEYQQRKKEKVEVQQLIEKQREQLSLAQASKAKYQMIIDTYSNRCFELEKMKQNLINQNDRITANINRTGKSVQLMSIHNQQLIDGLESLKQQMID